MERVGACGALRREQTLDRLLMGASRSAIAH